MDCRMEMLNVAVLPVPDWAWAMTSRPETMGRMARCWMAEGFSKSVEGRFNRDHGAKAKRCTDCMRRYPSRDPPSGQVARL